MTQGLWPYVWVAIALPLLVIIQKWVNRHFSGVLLLLTGNEDWSILAYSMFMLPGVFLHELSHWLTATFLGIRTGRFSLWPQKQKDGGLVLGYVEYYRTPMLDPVRESLVGGAPFAFGVTAILLIAHYIFKLPEIIALLQIPNIDYLSLAINRITQTHDYLLWIYLLFAISNSMLPSESDRRAWPGLIFAVLGFAIVAYFLDMREAIMAGVLGGGAQLFSYLGIALTLTIVLDLVAMIVLSIVEGLLSKLLRKRVRYG